MTESPPSGRSSTGFDEHLVGGLAYVLGLFSGIFLLFIEHKSEFVRFHARQSTWTFAGVLLVHLVLSGLPGGRLLTVLFLLPVIGLWALLIMKAVSGERYKLPYIGDLADRT